MTVASSFYFGIKVWEREQGAIGESRNAENQISPTQQQRISKKGSCHLTVRERAHRLFKKSHWGDQIEGVQHFKKITQKKIKFSLRFRVGGSMLGVRLSIVGYSNVEFIGVSSFCFRMRSDCSYSLCFIEKLRFMDD